MSYVGFVIFVSFLVRMFFLILWSWMLFLIIVWSIFVYLLSRCVFSCSRAGIRFLLLMRFICFFSRLLMFFWRFWRNCFFMLFLFWWLLKSIRLFWLFCFVVRFLIFGGYRCRIWLIICRVFVILKIFRLIWMFCILLDKR